ncbi:MAG: hypothetical protein K8U57_29705 [Planctomycetes bacterium]|nr:hypothetical protein [Planctomycetota bacterium]
MALAPQDEPSGLFYLGVKLVPGDMPTPPPEPIYLSGRKIVIVIATVTQNDICGEINATDEVRSCPEGAHLNTGNALLELW